MLRRSDNRFADFRSYAVPTGTGFGRQEKAAMRRRYVRRLVQLITALSFVAVLTPAAQQHSSATAEKEFSPDGPFLFAAGTPRPTPMDAFENRPVVESPDGKVGITVNGPKESYAAWVTVSHSAFPDGQIRVWPIQASVDVLWRPDSQAFAVTDMRNANGSYVLVCGMDFRMEDNEEGLGVPITDLTPAIENAFEKLPQVYYAGKDSISPVLYHGSPLDRERAAPHRRERADNGACHIPGPRREGMERCVPDRRFK